MIFVVCYIVLIFILLLEIEISIPWSSEDTPPIDSDLLKLLQDENERLIEDNKARVSNKNILNLQIFAKIKILKIFNKIL